jgi:hypothetical protein
LTDAAMFTAAGEVVQPSEVLYKKPILVERGSFRPVTKLTLDLLEGARAQFLEEPEVKGQEPVVLMEMTLGGLGAGAPSVDHVDFLARADILGVLGYDVLISRFEAYYQLADYLAEYTDRMIGIALGVPSLTKIADEQYYADLGGGMLESAGRLFKRSVRVYAYPLLDTASGRIDTVETQPVKAAWRHLRNFLLETGHLVPIRRYDESLLSIRTTDVLARIQSGDAAWEGMVPPVVAQTIKTKRLFGYCQAPGRA